MVNIELEFIQEGPFGYLIEKEPIEIAIIDANDQTPGNYSIIEDHPLLYKVVLDPKSIPKSFNDYEIIKVRGRRVGRTLDVLLDNPLTCQETGEEHRILTFKGSGALIENSYEDTWPIDPHNWRGGTKIKQFGRIWGALTSPGAKLESGKNFQELEQDGVLLTPYIASNVFPKSLNDALFKNDNPKDIQLAQALRLTDTNILIEDVFLNNISKLNKNIFLGANSCDWGTYCNEIIGVEEFYEYVNSQKFKYNLLKMINSLTLANKKLALKDKALKWTIGSSFIGNCYVNGRIKDFENLTIERKEEKSKDVLESAYAKVMNLFGEDLLTTKGVTFYPSYEEVKKEIQGDKPKRMIITSNHDYKFDESSFVVVENEFNLPAFVIAGHPLEDSEEFAFGKDGVFLTYRDLTIEDTIKLDEKLQKRGYRLATRAHLIAAYKNHSSNFERLLGHECPILTPSVIDNDKNILYDDIVLNKDGSINFEKSKKQVIQNPKSGVIIGWDENTAWPKFSQNDVFTLTYYKSGQGIAPITIQFNDDKKTFVRAENSNLRVKLPLAVYEFT